MNEELASLAALKTLETHVETIILLNVAVLAVCLYLLFLVIRHVVMVR